MKLGRYVLIFVIFIVLPAVAFGGAFKVYPGAKLDEIIDASQPEVGNKMAKVPKVIIFTTDDLFDNVASFYRSNAREYRTPGGGKPVKLSSGQELKEAYFILDDAADISTSKHWIKIQRPYLGTGSPGGPFYGRYEKIREVTAIIEEDKTSYP